MGLNSVDIEFLELETLRGNVNLSERILD